MTCQNCRELLADYQHGELDAAADATVFEHVSTCASCREELAAQTTMTETLRGAFAEELDLPMSVVAGVRQAVHRDRSTTFVNALRGLLRPIVLAPTAVAIMLVAGVASYVHNGSSAPLVSADYLVRQHVVHTMNSQSGDRAWNAYLLTSATSEDANAPNK